MGFDLYLPSFFDVSIYAHSETCEFDPDEFERTYQEDLRISEMYDNAISQGVDPYFMHDDD